MSQTTTITREAWTHQRTIRNVQSIEYKRFSQFISSFFPFVYLANRSAPWAMVWCMVKQTKRFPSNQKWQKNEQTKAFIKYMKYFVLFRITLVFWKCGPDCGCRVCCWCGVSMLLSFHYMKFYCRCCCCWTFSFHCSIAFRIAAFFASVSCNHLYLPRHKVYITCDYY